MIARFRFLIREVPKNFMPTGALVEVEILFMASLALKAPPIIQKAIDSGKGWAKLSLELLPQYAGDYIFISGWTGRGEWGFRF